MQFNMTALGALVNEAKEGYFIRDDYFERQLCHFLALLRVFSIDYISETSEELIPFFKKISEMRNHGATLEEVGKFALEWIESFSIKQGKD